MEPFSDPMRAKIDAEIEADKLLKKQKNLLDKFILLLFLLIELNFAILNYSFYL